MTLVLLFLLNTVSCTKGKVMPVVDAKVDANYVIQASWNVGEPKQCYTAPSAALDGQPMLLCGGVWGAWFIFHDPKLVNTAQSKSVSEAITKSAHYFPVQRNEGFYNWKPLR